MPVKLFFRSDGSPVHFNHWLNRLIRAPQGDSLLLTSGYVQEEAKYSILSDSLLESIKEGCHDGSLFAISSHGYEQAKEPTKRWKSSYIEFLRKLSKEPISVRTFQPISGMFWHAKMAIRLKGKEPIAALVGSSNLTQPAYSQRADYWNHECDVLIYPPKDYLETHFSGHTPIEFAFQAANSSRIPMGSMNLIFDPADKQPDEAEQIGHLYSNIMRSVKEVDLKALIFDSSESLNLFPRNHDH